MASLLIGSRGWSSSPRRAAMRCCDAGRRFLAARAGGVVEMANVIDRYNPKLGVLKAWTSWSASTLAVVRLGSTLPGWTVPKFKLEAAQLYIDVGAALAAGSESKLRNLVTPSCLPALLQSIRARPKGQRHTWETRNVQASIRHVRIGHHASNPGRQFAQITCSIDAQVVWAITDKRTGARVGGVGSAEAPHEAKGDLWIFERCITEPGESQPAWRLKEKMGSLQDAASSQSA